MRALSAHHCLSLLPLRILLIGSVGHLYIVLHPHRSAADKPLISLGSNPWAWLMRG
jgi:hypothetical protein